MIRGTPGKSYRNLPAVLYMLENTNPGTKTELKTKDSRFLYLFVALAASIRGWQHCKPVLIIDATFLRSPYGGTLLFAAAQDAAGLVRIVTAV